MGSIAVMKLLIVRFSLLLLLVASTAAEPRGDQKKGREKGMRNPEFTAQFFARLDQNQDGMISQDEFEANPRLERASPLQRKALFQRLDKNQDGFIQRKEIKPPRQAGRGERPNWLKNGPVDFEQFSKQHRVQRLSEEMRRRLFDRMDQNGDGVLSKEDLPRGRGKRPTRPDGPVRGQFMDTNEDEQVSFEEFQNAPFHRGLTEDEVEDRFEAIDQDSDGFLSQEELKAVPLRFEREKGKGKKK